jgi:hypothetical protein
MAGNIMSYLRQVNLGGTIPPFVTFQTFCGFVPNVFWAQTLLPRVIEAEAGIARAVLLEDYGLTRTQKATQADLPITRQISFGFRPQAGETRPVALRKRYRRTPTSGDQR